MTALLKDAAAQFPGPDSEKPKYWANEMKAPLTANEINAPVAESQTPLGLGLQPTTIDLDSSQGNGEAEAPQRPAATSPPRAAEAPMGTMLEDPAYEQPKITV